MAKLKIPNILAVPITVAGIVALAFLVMFIAKKAGAYNPQAYLFFTIGGIFALGILAVWARQIYWKIKKKGDYEEFPKKEE